MFVVYLEARDPDELEMIMEVAGEIGFKVIGMSDKQYFKFKDFEKDISRA